VLHRDVKPSNILVRADGSAQLFDFGLAQVEDGAGLTHSGDIAGTPYTLAPEQIDARCGAVDGRTDVWGLGVTLHEMLALRRPFDGAGPAALLRRILEDDPVPLRRLHAGLPTALQHVCATALEKPQRRRHASMAALRADLERVLAGRGVRARGAGWPRRLQRFVTREPARAAAIALAVLVVVAVPIGLLAANAAVRAQARRAELAAQEAGRQAAANAEVVAYLVGLFRPFEGDDAALQAAALAMLESQAQGLEFRFADQPLVRAALLEATGTVYANLEQHARALPLYDRALAIRQSEQGEAHLDTARLLEGLARVHLGTGDPASARDLCRRVLVALEAERGGGGAGATLAARARTTLARAEAQLGAPEDAALDLQAALDALEALPVPDDRALAEAREAAADIATQRGRTAEALAHGEAALAALLAEWFPERRALVRVFERLVAWRGATGDAAGAGAAAAAAETLRDAERASAAAAELPAGLRLVTPHRARYEEAFQAGITALQARRLQDAQARFAECAALRPGSAVTYYNQACAQALAGRTQEALALLERAEQAGYGLGEGQAEVVLVDADLAALRDEPRLQAVVERLRGNGARLRAWSAAPGVHLPPDWERRGPLPLLVVLHADGSSKDAVLAGPWRDVADALGAALLAPSARTPLGTSPADGMAWIEDVERHARQPWSATDAALEALRSFFAGHAVDRTRVLLAGEGSGALLALDLALRAPGLVRGVLLVQGPALVEGQQTRALTAAALGVRVGGWIDPGQPVPWVGDALGAQAYAEALQAWLAEAGLGSDDGIRVEAFPAGPQERAAELAQALAALLR
jgi:serine/threonine-protein kinase